MLLEPFEEPSDTDLERFQRFTGMTKDSDLEPLHQESLNSICNRSNFGDRDIWQKVMDIDYII